MSELEITKRKKKLKEGIYTVYQVYLQMSKEFFIFKDFCFVLIRLNTFSEYTYFYISQIHYIIYTLLLATCFSKIVESAFSVLLHYIVQYYLLSSVWIHYIGYRIYSIQDATILNSWIKFLSSYTVQQVPTNSYLQLASQPGVAARSSQITYVSPI